MAVGKDWVINSKDGYVNYKLTSAEDVNNLEDWAVSVQFEFSTTTLFE